MIVEQTISGCMAVYNYISGSSLLRLLVILSILFFPVVKLTFSLIKTFWKINLIEKSCSYKVPLKLKRIIKKYNLNKDLFLVSCEDSFTAVSIGFWNKKIILSNNLISSLKNNELEAVVLHEVYHTKFHHSLILFLSELLSTTLFFLPLFKDLQLFVKTELEKSADAYAVSIQKTTKYVKQSLRKIISQENNYAFFPKFSYMVIEQRIDKLNHKKRKLSFNIGRLLTSFIVLVAMFSLFLINKEYAMAATMEEKIGCSLFNCVRECVSMEIINSPSMSENNYSIAVPQN